MAIIDESDQAVCSYCAETVKPQATRCNRCGLDIPKAAAAAATVRCIPSTKAVPIW